MPILIYCHTHLPTGRRYVGRTSRDLMVRWAEHAREARDGRGNLPLHNAILSSQPGDWKHEVLEECQGQDEALAAELKWVAHYQTTDPARGFNRIGTGRKHEGHRVAFADRICGLVRLGKGRVLAAPKNFRTHNAGQRDALRGVLSDVGIAGAAIVWVTDDAARDDLRAIPRGDEVAFREWFVAYRGTFQLIDGHLRLEEIGDSLPCLVLDVDEREAAELLALFDPIGALAGLDVERYRALASEFNSTNSAVQSLVSDLAAIDARRRREAEEFASSGSSGEERGGGERGGGEKPPSGDERPGVPPPADAPAAAARQTCPHCGCEL